MTAQVTWSGKVSVFEVKLFLLYLQDLIQKIEKETKIGCLQHHMVETWSMVIMVIMMMNVDDVMVMKLCDNCFLTDHSRYITACRM